MCCYVFPSIHSAYRFVYSVMFSALKMLFILDIFIMLRSQTKLPNLNFAMPFCPPLWPHVTTLELWSEHPRNIMPEEFRQILWEKLRFNLKSLENNGLFTWKPTGLAATMNIWNVIYSAFIDVMNVMNTLLRKGSKFCSPLLTCFLWDFKIHATFGSFY